MLSEVTESIPMAIGMTQEKLNSNSKVTSTLILLKKKDDTLV